MGSPTMVVIGMGQSFLGIPPTIKLKGNTQQHQVQGQRFPTLHLMVSTWMPSKLLDANIVRIVAHLNRVELVGIFQA